MKKYSISPLILLVMAAFIVIDGSFFALCSVICSLLHELSHVIALRLQKGRVRRLSAGGKGIALATDLISYKSEIKVALAGPLASLFLFALFLALGFCLPDLENAVRPLAVSNLALFLLSVIPIYPLDGGRALRCLLLMKINQNTAIYISKIISFIFLLPLCAFSVIIFFRSGFNLSLLIICIYLLILLTGAYN